MFKILFYVFILSSNLFANTAVFLDEKEKAFLKEHPVIKVTGQKDWPPFDFMIGNKSVGYSVDIFEIISQKTGIKFEFVNGYNWNELWQMFVDKKVHIASSVAFVPSRMKYGIYTKRIYSGNTVYITKKETPTISNIEELYGKSFAAPKGWKNAEYIQKNHPQIKLILTENGNEALQKVKEGKAYATTNMDAVAYYILKKEMLTDLKINGLFFEFNDGKNQDIHFIVGKEYSILASIINKALDSITLDESQKLQEKWFGKYEKDVLTYEEREYLNKKNITLCVNPIWKPIDYIDDNGNHAGIGSFFIKDIEKAIGKKFTLLHTNTWSETHENIKANKCDVVSLIQKNTPREKYLSFTEPYFKKQSVFITKQNIPYIDNISLLKNKKVGIIKDSITYHLVKEKFKNLTLVEYTTLEEGLLDVEKGATFGFINLASSVSYIIQNKGLDLKISGNTGIVLELSLGVKKDEQLLFSIINKGLNTINEATRLHYSNIYSNITYEKVTDYKLIWKILFVAIMLLLIFFYWNRKLHLAKQEIEKKNQELDALLLIQSRQATFGTMIDTISHQWKQPLNELGLQIMQIDTQLRFEGTVPSKDSLEQIIKKSNSILDFMSKTIDIFRNFFKTSENKSQIDISKVMQNTILFLDSTFEVESIKINTDIEKHILIKALEEEFAHAILNILVNAKDIFKQKNIKNPTIDITMYTSEEGKIVIIIEDNAGGIKIKPIEKIFDITTSTKENGGLGLFITKKIIEDKLQGLLTVTNTPKGAKFTIII